jgi:hypothetical protein
MRLTDLAACRPRTDERRGGGRFPDHSLLTRLAAPRRRGGAADALRACGAQDWTATVQARMQHRAGRSFSKPMVIERTMKAVICER